MKMNTKKQIKGSQTAKAGFKNETDVIETFNAWQTDLIAQAWLQKMNYDLDNIEFVYAEKIKGSFKADIQVRVTIKLKSLLDVQNVQVKLVSNKKGFNQIDKRWVHNYVELWDIPSEVETILKHYTGELPPQYTNVKDSRRMFIDEFTEKEQEVLWHFFNTHKVLILSDILKGRGTFAAEWMLVVRKTSSQEWVLEPINKVLDFYAQGDIQFTEKGNIKIGRVTCQRKGGDGGRKTAQMLQFKIDPTALFTLESTKEESK
jgi:hypothetical protein